MRPKSVVLFAAVGLFLYWVVQAPVSAATTLQGFFDWAISFLTLIADRFVQFLDALF